MDAALMIDRLVPGANYDGSLTANTQEQYDALVWLDQRAKPTWAEVEAEQTVYWKEVLEAYLGEIRWEKEIAGVNFGGMLVPTDDRSKLLIHGAYSKALDENDPLLEKSFKVPGVGFVTMTNQQLIDMALAVATHVQDCFTAEAAVHAKIQAGTLTTKEQVFDDFELEHGG